ncbi:MAG: MraY family glycosyltransferase [Candidatus Poribacteria bacterium]|nr:MraY family glycosyltransferase [Candidatus Poribacteria bacterium]
MSIDQDHIVIAAATFAISVGVCELTRRVSHRYRLLDFGSDHSLHLTPTPVIGGIGVLTAFLGGTFLLAMVSDGLTAANGGLLVALLLVAAGGFVDDIRGLSPFQKIAVHTIAGAIFLFTNSPGTLPFSWAHSESTVVTTVYMIGSLAWIIGMTNALNLIDGVDSLAAGFTMTVAAGLGIAALMGGESSNALLLGVLLISVAGFLPFNLPAPRARMFMGDTGALSAGFLVAAFSLRVSFAEGVGLERYLLPFIVLSLPIFDVLAAIHRRRGDWSQADREHIHHRLIRKFGWSPRRTAATLVGTSAGMAALASLAVWLKLPWMTVALIPASFGTWWLFYTHGFARRRVRL